MNARRVAAVYRNRALAEDAADRLGRAGFDRSHIQIAEEAPPPGSEPGMFDRLAKYLVPAGAAGERGFVVGLTVPGERIDAAALALEAGADRVEIAPPVRISEQVVEMAETAERLHVDTQPVVVEEIVMRVQAREHVEHIHETVRHTQVEVERFGPDGDAEKPQISGGIE